MLTRLCHHVVWKFKISPSSPFTNRINLSSPFPKNLKHAHKVRWCYPLSQQASGEKAGVSNHVAYHSGNLPHIPKLTSSSHVHPFGIKNPKNHCFINVILQFIYSVLRSTQQKIHINNCVEGKISECLFDTAHKTPSAQEVETLKLQLSTYNSFFYWWNTRGCLWMSHVANWDHGQRVWAMPY